MYVGRKVSIYMFYKYDVLMTSALPFTAIFCQIQNKDVKVCPCLSSKLHLLKLPCFCHEIILSTGLHKRGFETDDLVTKQKTYR